MSSFIKDETGHKSSKKPILAVTGAGIPFLPSAGGHHAHVSETQTFKNAVLRMASPAEA